MKTCTSSLCASFTSLSIALIYAHATVLSTILVTSHSIFVINAACHSPIIPTVLALITV